MYPNEAPEIYTDEFLDELKIYESEISVHYLSYSTALSLFINHHHEWVIAKLESMFTQDMPEFAQGLRGEAWHRLIMSDANNRSSAWSKNEYYNRYINSRAWSEKRRQVMARDGNLCVCGDEAKEVHHKTYLNVGKENLSELVSLCKDCHDKYHDHYPKKVKSYEDPNKVIVDNMPVYPSEHIKDLIEKIEEDKNFDFGLEIDPNDPFIDPNDDHNESKILP